MVRKNELACVHGWKKDFWQPRDDADGTVEPPTADSLKARPTSAEIAAALMHVCPLDDGDIKSTPVSLDREDVVVGQQPIIRGFDRRRSDAAAIQAHAEDVSRDPGEAIRRAHEVFREQSVRQPRRASVTAPHAGDELQRSREAKPLTAPDQKNDVKPPGQEATGEAGSPPPSPDSAAVGTAPSTDGSLDAPERFTDVAPTTDANDDHAPATAARPLRWTLDKRLDVDLEGASNVEVLPGDVEPLPPIAPAPETLAPSDGIRHSAVESRENRSLTQPASLARHRWPPRNSGDAGLFPARVTDRVLDRQRVSAVATEPRITSSDVAKKAPESELSGHPRREWHERWQSDSLFHTRAIDHAMPDDESDDRPLLSHRIHIDEETPESPREDHRQERSRQPRATPDLAAPAETRLATPMDGDPTERPSLDQAESTARQPSPAAFSAQDGGPDRSWLNDQLDQVPRVCLTCRDFRPAESGTRGWCTNDWAFSHRTMVEADSRPCQTTIGSWWLPHEAIWLDPVDVQGHGHPTPLLDTYLGEPKERVSRRRS